MRIGSACSRRGAARIAAAFFLAVVAATPIGSASRGSDWVTIDYAALVDGREPTHSGEPVAVVRSRLQGRPVPAGDERPGDRLDHGLLDPLLEPYAFVLQDALDTLTRVPDPPWVEVGQLWRGGEAQPAWAELLRARRYLVESDGRGKLRICLPWSGDRGSGTPSVAADRAAVEAHAAAWPILRFVLAAERQRLGSEKADPLEVEVHAYVHEPARSRFHLGRTAHNVTVRDLRADGRRPPLDLERIRAFLDSGLQLEGARLEPDGSLRLLGSRVDNRPTLVGRPVDLADLAVAYRAVFHGGLAEPFMSLDRGYSPQTSLVSYGGRLRDTALGMVSLLCDIRFKTFSLGLDIVAGLDLRDPLRAEIPPFRTHLERFSADPASRNVMAQQTRLWFYPDRVDLTVSAPGDVLAMRRVRMSAASERVADVVGAAATGQDPPWTRATVEAINRDYEKLSRFFPEMAELDQVVRLLSLFTWLRQAGADGNAVPDLAPLLSVALPALSTPRTFPQLLSFNALPAEGGDAPVDVFDRVRVAEALERLNPPAGRTLDARRRVRRAAAALDPQDEQSAALLREIETLDLGSAETVRLDLMTFRAQRLRMHQTVLSSLDQAQREQLRARQDRGEKLRVFSVGIGGLDLGMGQVVERARGRSLGLGGGFTVASAAARDDSEEVSRGRRAARDDTGPREEWRDGTEPDAAVGLPRHGTGNGGSAPSGHWIRRGSDPGPEKAKPLPWIQIAYGADGPEAVMRKVRFDGARAEQIERFEAGRRSRYRLESDGATLRAVPVREPSAVAGADPPSDLSPQGLGRLIVSAPDPAAGEFESPRLRVRLEAGSSGAPRRLEAEFPRPVLQRVVLGPAADRTPGKSLPGLAPLPPQLGAIETLMVTQSPSERVVPWEPESVPGPGEESAASIARALPEWWSRGGKDHPAAVVGTDASVSPDRWSRVARPGGSGLLLLPADGFNGRGDLRQRYARAWTAGPVLAALPAEVESSLVVVISAEAPDRFAARLRDLARDPRMKGRLLAAWSLSGPMRSDLPRALIEDGLGAIGLGEASIVGMRTAVEQLARFSRGLAADSARRVEHLPGPFLWYY